MSDLLLFTHSYMDTEKYEEAVRDYEHVFKTNKTRGTFIQGPLDWQVWLGFVVTACQMSELVDSPMAIIILNSYVSNRPAIVREILPCILTFFPRMSRIFVFILRKKFPENRDNFWSQKEIVCVILVSH